MLLAPAAGAVLVVAGERWADAVGVDAHPGDLGAAWAFELLGRAYLEPAEHRFEEDASVLVLFRFHIIVKQSGFILKYIND